MSENQLNYAELIHKFLNNVLSEVLKQENTELSTIPREPVNVLKVKISLTDISVKLDDCFKGLETSKSDLLKFFSLLSDLNLFKVTQYTFETDRGLDAIFKINLGNQGIFAALSTPQNLSVILQKALGIARLEPVQE